MPHPSTNCRASSRLLPLAREDVWRSERARRAARRPARLGHRQGILDSEHRVEGNNFRGQPGGQEHGRRKRGSLAGAPRRSRQTWPEDAGIRHRRRRPEAGKRGDLPQGHAKERRLSTPPTNPSTVFDGESRGVILRRPSSLPQTYCKTSLDCTTNTRNAISRRLRPSKPGICSVSSAGTWEWQNTEIVDPQCTAATRPMKLMVSPRNAATLGTSRKT
jgi:hypothetical protein